MTIWRPEWGLYTYFTIPINNLHSFVYLIVCIFCVNPKSNTTDLIFNPLLFLLPQSALSANPFDAWKRTVAVRTERPFDAPVMHCYHVASKTARFLYNNRILDSILIGISPQQKHHHLAFVLGFPCVKSRKNAFSRRHPVNWWERSCQVVKNWGSGPRKASVFIKTRFGAPMIMAKYGRICFIKRSIYIEITRKAVVGLVFFFYELWFV